MPNILTAWDEVRLAAVEALQAIPTTQLEWLRSIHVGLDTTRDGNPVSEIRIPVPDVGAWSDPRGGSVPVEDINDSYISFKPDQFPAKAFGISDWDVFNSPRMIVEQHIGPAITRGLEYINRHICNVATTAHADDHAALTFYNGRISRDELLSAQLKLADYGVDVAFPNIHLVLPPVVKKNLMAQNEWRQATEVGDQLARNWYNTGVLGSFVAHDTVFHSDQTANVTGTAPSRTWRMMLTHKIAVAMGMRQVIKLPPMGVEQSQSSEYSTTIPVTLDNGTSLMFRLCVYREPGNRSTNVMIDCGFGVKVVKPKWRQTIILNEAAP